MREIKFRAWSDEREIMYTSEVVNLMIHFNGELQMAFENGTLAGTFNTPKLKVMQYTGLRDKNGTEIYEGDILSNGTVHQDVYWDKNDSAFRCNSKEPVGWSLRGMHNLLEVNGNKFENPELLEGQSCT